MTGKKALEQIRDLEYEITALKEYRERIQTRMTKVQGYDSVGTQRDLTRTMEKAAELQDRYIETGLQLDKMILRLDAIRAKTLETIEKIDDSNLRLLLFLYYVRHESVTEIERKTYITRATIFRKLKKATLLYENKYNE